MSIQLPDTHITQYSAYRVGIVAAQDPASGRVRVTFAERDQMTSWWLSVANQWSQANKGWWMPDLGEQVLCLMDPHDEDGAVLGAVYSTVDTPPNGEQPSTLRTTSNPVTPGVVVGSTLDQMFQSAAALYPNLATALPGVSGAGILEGLAMSESSLNTNALSPECPGGSYCYGIMQVNPVAHSGYTPQQLLSDVALNIAIGAADLAGRFPSNPTLLQFQTAISGYKGFSSYGVSSTCIAEVSEAIAYMHSFATA